MRIGLFIHYFTSNFRKTVMQLSRDFVNLQIFESKHLIQINFFFFIFSKVIFLRYNTLILTVFSIPKTILKNRVPVSPSMHATIQVKYLQ